MRCNNYLYKNIQKAFLPTVLGMIEHHAKLASVIKIAKQLKKSLSVAWLDIANAYGSVHHSLIQFFMAHHLAPPEFCKLLQSLYSGLSASVSTDEWLTPQFPFKLGVYQGDPLSVVIFLTVMNALSDTSALEETWVSLFLLPPLPSTSYYLLSDKQLACRLSAPA